MGYDAHEDTYATSCDEFSDSESELSSVEQLFKGYEPSLIVLDGSDHALFTQIEQLIDCLRASKLIQQVRVSTAFLQGLDNTEDNNNNKKCEETHALFAAIAGLHPICETFICHLHRHLARDVIQEKDGGLWTCAKTMQRLTLNNFLLTDDLIVALGQNEELTELRAYFDSGSKSKDAEAAAAEDKRGLDPLFLALSKSPRLQMLDVYAKEDERPEKPRRLTAAALTALCQNPTLQEVKLWHLDTDLTIAMAKALETDKTLKRISLNACFVKNEGYSAMAQMLTVNTALEKIHISDIVSADSCIELAKALESNNTLKELELTYESESNKVLQAMVEMLEKNTTLQQLKLYMSYSFENDMSFSAEKGTEYEESQAADDWELKLDALLEQNRKGLR
ncbi:Leucine-rich repeat protein [Seminavis robusta]|uniref:Leucine-rich repeat protein n=1 Tax=Seminavis robusta TaxID=568900 RepID=A0A9N8DY68_9STRA|nr:Leucine-rich repeat protein [Seminavis robusta]|eukprot:Sro468_g149060.1 Leucine-rich repeat protein (394) ;mRNA; f:9954-11135